MSTRKSFFILPPELRVEVYSYLLPHIVYPCESASLRQTCRHIRDEFDQKALAYLPFMYARARMDLAPYERLHTCPSSMARLRTVKFRVRPDATSHYWIMPFGWIIDTWR